VLERRIVEPRDIAPLTPAWRELTERSARSPFESPDWLLPWLRHYGSAWRPRLVTWWRADRLVAVAPVASRRRRRRGISYRELTFWGWTGTPLRGWVDVVADADAAADVAADFAAWLEAPDRPWDVFSYLHLYPDSPALRSLTARRGPWWHVDLSAVLHSLEYVVALPEDASGWRGQLGPKAQHEIRREIRLYERRLNGRIEEVGEAAAADEISGALASLLAERWGERDAYFARDPRFDGFIGDAVGETLRSGAGWALVARDPERIAACLFMLGLGRTTVALLIGVSPASRYRSMSLGKCLFNGAIEGALERGSREFSFMTENGYKTAFWHAGGRPTESGFFGRGVVGRAIVAAAVARQIPGRLRNRGGGPRHRYRP